MVFSYVAGNSMGYSRTRGGVPEILKTMFKCKIKWKVLLL